MCDTQKSTTNLVAGIAIGAAIGAGLTFLFATKKGKELRKRVRDEYPEVFDRLEEAVGDMTAEVSKAREEVAALGEQASKTVRSNVGEKLVEVGEDVESLGKQIEKPPVVKPRHFFKNGKTVK
jgi:gas vesicle protein